MNDSAITCDEFTESSIEKQKQFQQISFRHKFHCYHLTSQIKNLKKLCINNINQNE